ncbi:hypothetical protein [Chryseobacterium sp. 3008163]|uniref:hypothetical protein n=1 Tax=Chryseobacterium sp. 3008163 TaxID=2478663 RepID=UPI000F0C81DA|nr:hypothetical protein [Chryseobacterium sp. 3008163]AYM99183.1 hypothetical protein EAG08_01455 [Chryseobacterium sp. 3008163]
MDFAISKYLLKEDINEQVNYVANNEKMPFIFRQSFIYFYTKLYKEHNYLFWDHYFKIVQEESPLFRLLHQTTLIYVLVNCYSSVEDLNIIFQETDIDKKGQIVKKLLEGIRFLNRGNIREKDVDLLLKVSTCLHVTNVWEVNSLITISIEQYFLSEQLNVIKSLSDASCNCFDFVWENRKDVNSRDVLDHNGGVKAIDNIIKTLPFNIEKAQKFFNNILSLLNEEDFPIGYFYQLSDNIVLIYNHDNELATSIYKSLYFHTERSEKGTNLGNGVVLSLRSNRKQDYGMVHYALEEKFKEFLKLDFDFALALGIDIYNAVNDLTANKLYQKVNFEIGKSKFEICSDYSRYDYDSSNGPSSYINKILDEIGQNLNTKNTIRKGIEQLKRLMPLIKHAMVWRRVFQLLRRSPEKTKLIAFQLLSKREIYLFDELVYEAGELITAVWLNLTYLQKEKIEKIILSLHLDNPSSIIVSRIIQLINCIPTGQTTTKAAEEILADNMKVPNEPMVYEGNILADVSYSSREEKAKWSGFNVDDKDDDVLYKK